MRVPVFLRILLLISGALFKVATADAAPFSCDGNVYQVQSGQLKVFDPLTSTYVNVGAAVGSYNATGYNVLDNYAYGVLNNDVIRIQSDGTIQTLYNIAMTSNAGDIDDTNTMYIRNGSTAYSRVNLATGTLTSHTITGTSFAIADLIWVRNAGTEFLLSVETNGPLKRINLSTNVGTALTISGLPIGAYGAMWRDSSGRIFVFNNTTGAIYELFGVFGSSPTAVLVAQGLPSGNNDGFSCATAPFPNLPPLANNDAFSTPFDTAVSGNVLSNNGSGVDTDPEGTTLTVDTVPVVGPANGTVTINANGTITYTPGPTFVGTDTFTYRVTDSSGLSDTAVVTITVPAPTANLVTVKTLGSADSTPGGGETVTFRIVVTNNGPGTAPAPSLTDSLPAGLTYTTHTVTQGAYISGTGVWNIGRLNNGQSATINISGTVNAGQQGLTKTNNTTAAGGGGHTDPTNTGNDLTESVTIANAGHSIVKTQISGPNPVTAAGQTIGYRIAVANAGNVTLTSIVVTDTLLLGVAPRTVTSGPTYASGDTDSDIQLDTNETWIYNATYVVTQADVDGTGSFSNSATVDSMQTSPTTSSALVTPVTRSPNLQIVKAANTAGPVSVNNVIGYTYTVTNTGNVTISGVGVTDVHGGVRN